MRSTPSRTSRRCRLRRTSSPSGSSTRRASPLLAGSAFGCHAADHLRISYASSLENLERGGRAHRSVRLHSDSDVVATARRGSRSVLSRRCRRFVDVHSHVVPSGDDGAELDRGGARALPARARGRHGDPLRDARTHTRRGTRSRAPPARDDAVRRRVRRDARRGRRLGARSAPRLGGVSRARSPARDPAELVLEGTRGVLIEFPGSWLEIEDPIAVVADAAARVEAAGLVPVLGAPRALPRGRSRPRARASARRARLAPVPQRSVARRQSRRGRRANGLGAARGRPRRARSLRRPLGLARPPTLDRAFARGARAARRRQSPGPCSTAAPCPGSLSSALSAAASRPAAARPPRAARWRARNGGSRRSRCSPSTAKGARR